MDVPADLELRCSFEDGGPLNALLRRVAVVFPSWDSIARRILVAIGLTWVPLLVLAILEGVAFGATPRQSFLLDYPTYARFFVGVPVVILGDRFIGSRLRTAAMHFIRSGLVKVADMPAFEAAVVRAARRRGSRAAELVLAVLAFGGSWAASRSLYGDVSWQTIAGPEGSRISLAGAWYLMFALPVLQFLIYRWLWRLLIWTVFLWTVSRLDLQLVATHADQAGGLGFLAGAQKAFWILSFAAASVLSAEVAFRLIYEKARPGDFELAAWVFVGFSVALIIAPLLVFVPALARARREALRTYGALVNRYNQAFHARWISAASPPDAELLGAADIQSLADLGNSYGFIKAMRPVPFTMRNLVEIAVLTALPTLPLLPIAMPIAEVIKVLGKALF